MRLTDFDASWIHLHMHVLVLGECTKGEGRFYSMAPFAPASPLKSMTRTNSVAFKICQKFNFHQILILFGVS